MANKVTREEYRHVVVAVFYAEDAVNKRNPELLKKLKEHKVSPDEYIDLITDEIINNQNK